MWHVEAAGTNAAVMIMGCKFVCQMFSAPQMSTCAWRNMGRILTSCARAAQSPNARVRECYANVLSNLALYTHEQSRALSERATVMDSEVLATKEEKQEGTVLILMVALGTLMTNSKGTKQYGAKMDGVKWAENCAGVSARLQEVENEIREIATS